MYDNPFCNEKIQATVACVVDSRRTISSSKTPFDFKHPDTRHERTQQATKTIHLSIVSFDNVNREPRIMMTFSLPCVVRYYVSFMLSNIVKSFDVTRGNDFTLRMYKALFKDT